MSLGNGNGASVLDSRSWTSTLAQAERQAGRREARKQIESDLDNLFKDAQRARWLDIDRAQQASVSIYEAVQSDLGIKCIRVYLRQVGGRAYEALFFVSAEDFGTERFEEAYDIGWLQTEKLESDGIEYDASFAPLRGEIRHHALVQDGFFTYFESQKQGDSGQE